MIFILGERSQYVPLGFDCLFFTMWRSMESRLFFLVVLTLKVNPWYSCKLKYERDSWEALSNSLYILRVLRERVFVRYVWVH